MEQREALIFQYHDVPGGNADAVLKVLQAQFPDPEIRMALSSAHRIFVYARRSTHEVIANNIHNMGK